MAVYGFLAYLTARELSELRQRFEVVYWAVVMIMVIGFSRIFLSVHYASDFAAGWLVGCFWILAGVAAAEYKKGAETANS
jgi:undecaprenyl-diphosphatase